MRYFESLLLRRYGSADLIIFPTQYARAHVSLQWSLDDDGDRTDLSQSLVFPSSELTFGGNADESPIL